MSRQALRREARERGAGREAPIAGGASGAGGALEAARSLDAAGGALTRDAAAALWLVGSGARRACGRGASAAAATDTAEATEARARPLDPRLARATRREEPLTLGLLARRYWDALLEQVPAARRERARWVLSRVRACRTPELGGTHDHCERCGFEETVWRSCSDRHCPTCGGLGGVAWLTDSVLRALPVASRHVVVTLPPALRPLARRAPREVYGLLLTAAREAVERVVAEQLGEQRVLPAIVSVLHTWNRWSEHHPHAHLIVSEGGLSRDGARWVEPQRGVCPLPGVAVGAAVRERLLRGLEGLRKKGKLPGVAEAGDDAAWAELLARLRHRTRIEVYAKEPLAGPAETFAYLASYVKRLGLSNRRLKALDPVTGIVTLETKKGERFELHAVEVLERFLLHVLPVRFHRVRYGGVLAQRRSKLLAKARELILAKRRAERDGAEASELARLRAAAAGARTVGAQAALEAVVRLLEGGGAQGTALGDAAAPAKPLRKETARELYRRVTGIDYAYCPGCDAPLSVTEVPRRGRCATWPPPTEAPAERGGVPA